MFDLQSDLTPALDCPMNKPNVSESTVSARFTEVQQHLKSIHLLLDSIQSEPYIPSIRQNGLAYLSDKVDNLQGNVHSMAMQLAHLG